METRVLITFSHGNHRHHGGHRRQHTQGLPRTVLVALASTLVATVSLSAPTVPVLAAQSSAPPPATRAMPSAVPSTKTPSVDDGDVRAIARLGPRIVIGGYFTHVDGRRRQHVAAFNQKTGAVTSFAPRVDGPVLAVIPGPTPGTVYLGGNFSTVGSTAANDLALVNVRSGKVVSSFSMPPTNFGAVNDLVLRGGRLYVAGTFSRIGSRDRAGLVSLNSKTGAVSSFLQVRLTGHHNDSGDGVHGWVGAAKLDVTPDGRRMVVIGNFKRADDLLRDQVVMIDLTGPTAHVRADWSTSGYAPYCFNWAFDSYVRGVSFSPDGSYFAISATGGPNPGTLCDATARFQTAAKGSDVAPTWVSETGGDTVWATAITDTAIFVGGHQRWANNPTGSDNAGPGAVPRPGLMALDPASGRPLRWNPGRNPPGKSVYALLATRQGLYVGSNTDWIGNRTYKRRKIAFFPYTGGVPTASTSVGRLPGSLYLGGSLAPPFGANGLVRIRYDGTTASHRHHVGSGGVRWRTTRGAFMVGNRVFYGDTDGYLHWRAFDGKSFKQAHRVDPYHDPRWANVDNHLGGTFDGASPSLYAQLSSVAGMFYAHGRLYYTLRGDPHLYARWFSPDSGIMDETTQTVASSVTFSDAGGMFVSGKTLYYTTRSEGNLVAARFAGGAVTGSATVVSGPHVGGVDWRGRSLFLLRG